MGQKAKPVVAVVEIAVGDQEVAFSAASATLAALPVTYDLLGRPEAVYVCMSSVVLHEPQAMAHSRECNHQCLSNNSHVKE